ncbi:hypothetical protein [Jeotgalibacillus proteolyticus]|uniref:Uncharacterized protein n=1 Tax=Jeotgalibacillus proteolyticus TaxID=2082395 RepID=A0A2S5GAG5_9BACL|nr:hypothetical protein [Jeotgalibacillus proteolyticus]PPA69979.1 hypothetical protein C4B60_10280 [Jeotgalibacillus proteolyticus]
MKLIRSKKDAENFISNYDACFTFDHDGKKYYFIFEDHERNGQWTLMHYESDNRWTVHSMGEDYCEDGETELENEELVSFIFKNRKYINVSIKNLEPVLVES